MRSSLILLVNHRKVIIEEKNNSFILRCSYSEVHNWGLSMHYKGDNCEVEIEQYLQQELAPEIVCNVSSVGLPIRYASAAHWMQS